ncbi:MAG: carbamoyltransferase C-terminal domain-containing protein [Verrucomicrobiota bacterium]
MKALAIHYGHNCTVGLSIDGEVVSLLSEERLCRIKNATGFPIQTIRETVDRYLDGDMSQLDHIGIIDGTGLGAVYLRKNGVEPKRYLDYYWMKKAKLWRSITHPGWMRLKRTLRSLTRRARGVKDASHIRDLLIHELGLPPDKVQFFDHHSCHAAAAAYFSPVADGSEWLMMSLDAEGDNLSSTVSVFDGKDFKRLSTNPSSVSLGYLYSETTAYLGMKSNEHEFKLMGMAPYADPVHVERLATELKRLIWLDQDGGFVTQVDAHRFLHELCRIYAFERFDVISGAVQKVTEELAVAWVNFWSEKTRIGKITVSGGVFMNVKMAKLISELAQVEYLFVVPSCSDESLPIGALWFMNTENGTPTVPVKSLYLGRGFARDHVRSMIERDALSNDFDIEEFADDAALAERIASLLADNEIVARCCGREEWGARALGNRSILCNPSNFSNIERLNSKIKCRDFWMPFTPSLLAEAFPTYVVNPKNIFAPYMAITFDVTPLARQHFAAAVHPRDFTMRPQAVIKDWNPGYHAIISEFQRLAGIGGILNTSFNLHGEPNVSTPEDAIRTVRNSGLDYVLIENFLFHKKPQTESATRHL